MIKISIKLFLSLWLIFSFSYAQINSYTDSTSKKTTTLQTASFQPTKSAWLAVCLSTVIPGAGQIYNETYWKVPIIWGLGGYWISVWIDLNKNYLNFRNQYIKSISISNPTGNKKYLQLRDWYRDERDKFAWYLGALYFLNLVDAYVGAHLYDFDVSPDISVDGKTTFTVKAFVKIDF